MSIPDAAIEAAAQALLTRNGHRWNASKRWDNFYRDHAGAAIEAAMPAIREAIVAEISREHDQRAEIGDVGALRGLAYAELIVRGGAK